MNNKTKVLLVVGFVLALFAPQAAPAQSLTQAESKAVVGDQPDDPGPLATDLSPVLRSPSIRAAMRKVANWQLARVSETPSQDWTFATLYVGFLAAAHTLNEPRYQRAVVKVGEHYHWQLGPRQAHADDQAIGQSYLEIYKSTHDQADLASLRKQFDTLTQQPDDPAKPVWWWCDALFMAPPVWSGLAQITTNDATTNRAYLAYMNREWLVTENLLYDKQAHLFSRDANYLSRTEPNGAKVFWSRGNGWVLGGLVRVISSLPQNDPARLHYVELFRQMAAKVASIQSADGLWRAGLLDPDGYALPETSGSAFFIYAMAWGVSHGMLDEAEYRPVIERGWAGLLQHVYADGRLGCIQPVGEAPGHYKPSSSYVFGVGAFLLAGSELDKLSIRKEFHSPAR